MIIVCTSRSGYTRSGNSSNTNFYAYGDMLELLSETLNKLQLEQHFKFAYSQTYWRVAIPLEVELFSLGHRNMNILTKF